MGDGKINEDLTTKIITLLEGVEKDIKDLKDSNTDLAKDIHEIRLTMAKDANYKEKVDNNSSWIEDVKSITTAKGLSETIDTVKKHTGELNKITGSWKTIGVFGGLIAFFMSVFAFFKDKF